MNKFIVLAGLSLLFLTSCNLHRHYTVAFYNTENLFDTINSGIKSDGEFTPESPKNWNTAKYHKKISDIAHVVSSINHKKTPALMGLCEIENDVVLKDLVTDPQLRKADYRFIWRDSPDLRGIDCALLYNPNLFKLIRYEMLPVTDPEDTTFATRDIIYAQGYMGKDLFHLFVNHWPSKRGGAETSTGKRDLAATVLRNKMDAIFKDDSSANIIIMGDLNDIPSAGSINKTLNALPNHQIPKPTDLVNLMYDEFERNEGSYSYRNKWEMIDNLIVSGNVIIKKKGLKTTIDNGFIFHKPFMEFVDEKGEMSPNRTYGKSYYGGISDHFPVYMILK